LDLERLKATTDILKKYKGCINMDCDGNCDKCSCYYETESFEFAIDTAITVIGDVIKNMEKLKNEQS